MAYTSISGNRRIGRRKERIRVFIAATRKPLNVLRLNRHRVFQHFLFAKSMKHAVKLLTLLVAITAFWTGLLQTAIVPRSHTWLLPIYFIVSLGCYGVLMVGIGLMCFPTCPQEAVLLQQDIKEAKEYLKGKGVDVGSD